MEDVANLTVFVYGTLKPGGRYWAQYIEGRVTEQRPARVRGHLFALSVGYPAMMQDGVPSKDAEPGPFSEADGPWVHGWRLVMRDEAALRGLDELEGYDPAREPEKNDYNRVRKECFAEAGMEAAPLPVGAAWVYVMARERIAQMGGVAVEGGDWLEVKKT